MYGVCGADRDDMLVNVICVHVVEMAIMKIVNMVVMANRHVPAVRAMLVGMVGMVLFGEGDHEIRRGGRDGRDRRIRVQTKARNYFKATCCPEGMVLAGIPLNISPKLPTNAVFTLAPSGVSCKT
jgi:hypothetical protein